MSKLKLFGKTIRLTSNDDVSDDPRGSDHNLSCSNASVSLTSLYNKKQSNAEMDSTEDEERKPDKILQCPRCESNDTKFCYFNNYNLNQPRHFCKTCQRYWTAGGAVRNVPVGSGRRKNKIDPETEQLTSKSFHASNPNFNCFPAPPWYPAPILSSPLGKHSREGELMKSKTVRIDDPSEVAKSSIWATLIKNEKVGSVGVFGGFESKFREVNSVADGSLALYANPAAFSRSLRFHESAE